MKPQNEVVIRFAEREYFSGETIHGNIEIFVKGPPLWIRKVKWNLHVSEHFMTPVSDVKRAKELRKKNNKRASSVRDMRPLAELQEEEVYEDGNRLLNELDQELVHGMHRFPFSFSLPSQLPPSFRYGSKGMLEYEIWAEIALPAGKPLRACRTVQIGGRLFEREFVKENSVPATCIVSKDIGVFPGMGRGTVDLMLVAGRGVYTVGEEIGSTLVIGNFSSRALESVEMKLKMDVYMVGYTHRKYVLQDWSSDCSIARFEGTHGYEVKLKLIDSLPGTILSRRVKDNISIGTLINVSYYLSATVKLGFGRQIKAKVPLTVLRPDILLSKYIPPPPTTSVLFNTSLRGLRLSSSPISKRESSYSPLSVGSAGRLEG